MNASLEQAVDWVLPAIARWTGFRSDAIERSAVHRGLSRLAREGVRLSDVMTASPEGRIREVLEEAVSVGETYFFREGDHFLLAASEVVPELVRSGNSKIRAWSAGCSNGAEAFSLAACLRASAPADVDVEVLGTDLVRRHVEEAERGVFRAHSVRESGPALFPALERTRDGAFAVGSGLRNITRFAQHNLLDDPPFGQFDVIFCRNVLVYLTGDAARRVVSHLERCLSPHGALFLGAADLTAKPEGLVRCGSGAVQIFKRPATGRSATCPPAGNLRAIPAETTPAARRTPTSDERRAVARHLVALEQLERGELRNAMSVLADIVSSSDDYVPALLERALLHNRRGERREALYFMKQVLRRTAALPATEVVAGPEPMPVEFYRRTATAFIERNEGAS